jgi:hypothetical protein
MKVIKKIGAMCIDVIFISVLSLYQKTPSKARQQCTYSVTFRRVLVTIVALEKQ